MGEIPDRFNIKIDPYLKPYRGILSATDLPLRQQLKHGLRDMYRSSLSSGRNFAIVGSVFSGTECAIEGLRAKNDIWNGVAGGCITGGILARKAGPQTITRLYPSNSGMANGLPMRSMRPRRRRTRGRPAMFTYR